uniref:Uncharacterized protein n=1 Tax=Candidatus Kentrum eta TaxID=2126337 RepID=A0A450UET1_9GAMM|nr:MAG: hypothetical protein BECKH772A_GA0070896_1002514 [Candidatus Kentron sp. H]VFJ98697.1 MAG: hypothetical protein BECKH772C_GA0070978_1002414 [Candidatus Kentron sp. H]
MPLCHDDTEPQNQGNRIKALFAAGNLSVTRGLSDMKYLHAVALP